MLRSIKARAVASAFLFLVATACASAGTQRPSSNPDKLTRDEIAATSAPSAYEVLSRLRPNWLNPPGLSMTGIQNSQNAQVLVYLDGMRIGGIPSLRTIAANSIVSMEFLSPTKAQNVIRDMNSSVAASVIMISTK